MENLHPYRGCCDKEEVKNMRLEGKVAIVTGAGSGLGRSVVLALAGSGWRVAMIGPDHRQLDEVVYEIEKIGSSGLAVEGDVSVAGDVNRLVNSTRRRFGTVDVLFNNAGIIGPPRFLEDASPDDWFRTINVNLNGMYLTSRAVIPLMIDNGGGRIINVTSGLGRMPFPRFCAYGVSKAGVDQLTRSLSEEFREEGILVNAIDPGVMDTGMQADIRHLGEEVLGSELFTQFNSVKTLGRLNDPAEVAQLVVYLASDEADGITGRILSMADLPEDFEIDSHSKVHG